MTSRNQIPRAHLELLPGRISGVWRFVTHALGDDRGFFCETYRDSVMSPALGRNYRFAQTNHSRSRANTLRGFRSESWDKLVYIPRGTALCVVVDPRKNSPTFRQHETFLVGDPPGGRERILISRGLCNAFYCLTETDYLNDVSAEFDASVRRGFRWNDPSLGIDWPCDSPLISDSDRALPDFETYLAGV